MRPLLVALVLLASALARAEGDRGLATNDKAKARFVAGMTAYQAADFEGAIKEFAAGYAVEPWPGFLFAWAQAERQREHCNEAVALYERFLASEPPADAAQLAKDGIAACGTSPKLAPAKPLPARPVYRRERVPGFHQKLALGLSTGGALLGGASLVTYLLGRGAERDAMRQPTLPEVTDRYERAKDLLVVSPILGGIGAALLIAGGIRFAVHGPEYRTVVVTPSGVAVGGTF